MKLLRTIRFDTSDTRVFPRAAEPGEWAVPGAFVFAGDNPEAYTRQERQAFANGFLGLSSFGWSTFVTVATIAPEDYEAAIEALAQHLMQEYGAPSLSEARQAAAQEVNDAVLLCEQPINTLLAVSRRIEEEGIAEDFRVVAPPGEKPHAKLWEIVPDER